MGDYSNNSGAAGMGSDLDAACGRVNRPPKVVVVSSHLSIISRRHEMPGMFDNFKPDELFNTRVLGLKTGPNLKSALLRKALLNFTRTYQRYYWAPWLSIERHKQK